jgi:hypothetical protein
MFGEDRHTRVEIDGEDFVVNDEVTHEDVEYRGHSIEGLLFNARMIQALFDDENPETRDVFAYPDTGEWDPERNVQEFLWAIPEWQGDSLGRPRLDAITINFQCGRPVRHAPDQPWIPTGFEPDGSLKQDWLDRLERVLDRTDLFGMVVILGYFYGTQEARMAGEEAVRRGARNLTEWLLDKKYTNVLIEVNNECNWATQENLQPERVHEMIEFVQGIERDGFSYDVSTSFLGGPPTDEVADVADYILLHGNHIDDPNSVGDLVEETRSLPSFEPMPIVFNEDDHYGFDSEPNNFFEAVASGASWGYFDPGVNDYETGYQCPPVDWGITTERERAFFDYLDTITSGGAE